MASNKTSSELQLVQNKGIVGRPFIVPNKNKIYLLMNIQLCRDNWLDDLNRIALQTFGCVLRFFRIIASYPGSELFE